MPNLSHIEYDLRSQNNTTRFKAHIGGAIKDLKDILNPGRERAIAMTKLEEAYMWIGKAIRNDQLSRENHFAAEGEDNGIRDAQGH